MIEQNLYSEKVTELLAKQLVEEQAELAKKVAVVNNREELTKREKELLSQYEKC